MAATKLIKTAELIIKEGVASPKNMLINWSVLPQKVINKSIRNIESNELLKRVLSKIPPPTTIANAYTTKAPMISKMRWDQSVFMIIGKTVKNIGLGFSNVTNNINKDVAGLFAEMLIENYPDIKITELDLIFKMAIRGDFGISYNRIDVAVMMDWVKQYYSIRGEYFAVQREGEHHNRIKHERQQDSRDYSKVARQQDGGGNKSGSNISSKKVDEIIKSVITE